MKQQKQSPTGEPSRIGPRMAEAFAFVSAAGRPCTLIEVARHVAPEVGGRVGLGFGYAVVHRTIRAGLLRSIPHPTVRGRVLVTVRT